MNIFTKSDLRTGDIVTCRDGRERTVALNTPYGDILKGKRGAWNGLSHHADNLTHRHFGEFDINKVQRPKNESEIFSPGAELEIVWERSEPIKFSKRSLAILRGGLAEGYKYAAKDQSGEVCLYAGSVYRVCDKSEWRSDGCVAYREIYDEKLLPELTCETGTVYIPDYIEDDFDD